MRLLPFAPLALAAAIAAAAPTSSASGWLEFERWPEARWPAFIADHLNATYAGPDLALARHSVYVASADLDGLAPDELLVHVESQCGGVECPTLLFQRRHGAWTPIGRTEGYLYLGDERENGYRILYRSDAALKLNGSRYALDADGFNLDAYISETRLDPSPPPEALAALADDIVYTYKCLRAIKHPLIWPELQRLLGPNLPRFLKRTLSCRAYQPEDRYLLLEGSQRLPPREDGILFVELESGAVHAAIETAVEGAAVPSVFEVYTDRARFEDLPDQLRWRLEQLHSPAPHETWVRLVPPLEGDPDIP